MPLPLRLTFWISVLAALANAAVYVATFLGHAYYPVLFFLPLLFLIWPTVLWQWRRVPRRNLVSEIFGDIPRWLKLATVGLLLFAFANFFVCRALNDQAHPELLPDGRHVLRAGEHVVRVLSLEEFRRAEAVQVRMLGGFFVTCFAIAALLAEACWIKNGPAMADRKIPASRP